MIVTFEEIYNYENENKIIIDLTETSDEEDKYKANSKFIILYLKNHLSVAISYKYLCLMECSFKKLL